LFDVIKDVLEPFGVTDGRAERIVIVGENIRFSPKAALVLGIAFNELATNAVKYGALSTATGSVRIKWTVEPAVERSQLLLQWQEKDGPPVTAPSHKGFGSRVIERGVVHELEGTVHLDYQSDGLICTMTFPTP
jgi:two-component sensor histidine kinase